MSLISDIEQLPDTSGVYLIKDKNDDVIYIGKAKNLKDRVRQHFLPSSAEQYPKEKNIQDMAVRVDWLETRNETEAIVLEQRLIKDIKPKLNVIGKDDKSSLLIRISTEDSFPQLSLVRETDERVEGSTYFGPHVNANMMRDTVKLVLKLFGICNCGRDIAKCRERNRSVRCMRKRLKQCLAPCENDIGEDEYHKAVESVIMFLKGDVGDLLDELEEDMWAASKKEDFEQAAKLRNLITAIKQLLNVQKMRMFDVPDIDVLAYREDDNVLAFCKILIRERRIKNLRTYIFPYDDSTEISSLDMVISLLYEPSNPPSTLVVSNNFQERFANKLPINVLEPKSEASVEIVNIAEKNAFNELAKYFRTKQYKKETESLLNEVKTVLKLDHLPRIIHGYDISTLGGQHSTGSSVVFVNGEPAKHLYRRFRIRREYGQPNDYAMMNEVLTRRYTSPKLSSDPKPDLIVIDGGKGQFSIAKQVLEKLSMTIPMISIAKKEEIIFTGWADEPLNLPQDSSVLQLIQQIRDESHRFAISYNKKLRGKTIETSIFEEIKGIGRKKAQLLLQTFGSVENISQEKANTIAELLGIKEDVAEEIINLAQKRRHKSYDF